MADTNKNFDMSKFFYISVDMMCIASTDGYFKLVNNKFPQILGYAEEEFYDKPFIEFVHPDDRQKTIDEIHRLSQGFPTINFDNRYLASDGQYKWISWNASLGDDNFIYAIAREITSEKNKNQEIEKKAAEYEELNKLMVGRELKMAELKKKIAELEAQVGQQQQEPSHQPSQNQQPQQNNQLGVKESAS